MIKNIEIAADVFRKAAEKAGKMGEREWKEVIEQQGYILDEIIVLSKEYNNTKQNQYKQRDLERDTGKSNFALALGDFNFCLKKALDNLVSQDSVGDY